MKNKGKNTNEKQEVRQNTKAGSGNPKLNGPNRPST
ncbi:hypothetical protein DFR59_10480 [Falsibacillus pallidus]|uniref:Uncharacterized protein n=1 Tax=Falsibacillus pallidus TaxID=493781 RepID=A0A370GI45_9BACI|nr:hypothetical protein DFR59_10480 [Falsibacillus pallidus]